MSMQLQPYSVNEVRFDRKWLEVILLEIADAFNIQVVWDNDLAFMTGVLTVAGGLLGAFFGGKTGAAVGAGIGGATGIGMAQVKPLREIWSEVREKLEELFYIVFNFLRKLDASDYLRAFEILMSSLESRQQLVKKIIAFITEKLGREVLCSITSA